MPKSQITDEAELNKKQWEKKTYAQQLGHTLWPEHAESLQDARAMLFFLAWTGWI